ncbi:MAG: general secretion pathway protein GspK [Candidatus Omnitrophica bacterium]|nr:general secretion pathway protein GspK [Candidatus Omnitrophota bacterium]
MNIMKPSKRKKSLMCKGSNRASILILVLWSLGLLTIFALYLGLGVRQRLDFLLRVETRSKLYRIAEAGVKQAAAQIGNFGEESPVALLKDTWSNNVGALSQIPVLDGSFTVGYSYKAGDLYFKDSEADKPGIIYGAADVMSRLNINSASLDELSRLIEYTSGIDSYRAEGIASCIIDWRDADNASLPNGAEDKYYRSLRFSYDCKDFPLENLEELYYIKGMDKNVYDRIKPYITVHGSGRVNINTALAPVFYALGLNDSVVKKILLYRSGEDQVIANSDDCSFSNENSIVAQLSQVYSMSPSEIAQLSNIVADGKTAVFSHTFLISSVAVLDKRTEKCKIECVIEKNLNADVNKAGWILDWKTEFFI